MRYSGKIRLLVIIAVVTLSVSLFPCCSGPAAEPSQPQPPEQVPESTPVPPPPPAPVEKETELKYDDGSAEEFLSHDGGYLIDFAPPSTPFTINKVRIFGLIAGEATATDFDIEIWDKNYKVLFNDTCPVSGFTSGSPSWVDVDLPGIEVNDTFYVKIYTGTGRLEGIHIGADDSVVNLHSGCSVKTLESGTRITTAWDYPENLWFGDISKVNWMIRVAGTYLEPTTTSVDKPGQSPGPAVRIDAKNGTERELRTKAILETLLVEYDVSKWLFTDSVVIEEGVIPHSHPTLTLSDGYVSYENMLLSVFVHEQIHWFCTAQEAQVNEAIDEFKKVYPNFKVDKSGFLSAPNEHSVYLHFIVNYLELSAMSELVGEEAARSTIERMGHYIFLYNKVLSDTDAIGEIVRKHGLIIE